LRFEIVILGCGAATPTLRHNPTSQAVNWDGRWFLVDAGEGVQLGIRRHRIPLQKIEGICISHLHGDHVLGLPGLLGSMNLFGRTASLNIYGPIGLEQFVKQALKSTETYVRFQLIFHSNSKDACESILQWGDCTVQSVPVKHRIPAYGYVFDYVPTIRNIKKEAIRTYLLQRSEILTLKAGKDVLRKDGKSIRVDDACMPSKSSLRYAYSGDTTPCDSFIQAARNADVIYHEATFMTALEKTARKTGHSTAFQAGHVAIEAEATHLVIGHLSSRYRDEEAVLEEAKTAFVNSSLAQEGMRIRLNPQTKRTETYLE